MKQVQEDNPEIFLVTFSRPFYPKRHIVALPLQLNPFSATSRNPTEKENFIFDLDLLFIKYLKAIDKGSFINFTKKKKTHTHSSFHITMTTPQYIFVFHKTSFSQDQETNKLEVLCLRQQVLSKMQRAHLHLIQLLI